MGAECFSTIGHGKTVHEAFLAARDHEAWQYGHAGYTGTLAEKTEYIVLTVPDGLDAETFANWVNQYLPGHDIPARYLAAVQAACAATEDKWGPAGALQLDPEAWLFFGWASS